jgi:Protein of unknown function (DUF2510)
MALTPAPGWYPDPGGAPALRWWDGTGWTEHVAGPDPVPTDGPVWSAASLTYVEVDDGAGDVAPPFELRGADGAVLATAGVPAASGAWSTLHTVTVEVRDAAGGLVLSHVNAGGLARQPDVVRSPSGWEWGRLVWTNAWREDQLDLVSGGVAVGRVVPQDPSVTRFVVVDPGTSGLRATLTRQRVGSDLDRWSLERDPSATGGLVALLLALPITLQAVVDHRDAIRRRRRRERHR